VGGGALALFVGLIAASAAVALLLGPPLLALVLPEGGTTGGLGLPSSDAAQPAALPPLSDWITAIVPSNPVAAAADGAMLPFVVFTVLFALALRRVEGERGHTIVSFVDGLSATMMTLVGWILVVAPIGVFCLVLPLAGRMGLDLVAAVGGFLLVACGLVVLATLALYPLAVIGGRVPLRTFAVACAPAQAVAFGTRSSLASLPLMLEAAERVLRLPVHVSGVALPAAVSVFKFASPIARFTGALTVAHLYGVQLGPAATAALAASIALLSFYSPGVPSGGVLVMTPVFVAFGIPVEGIGLLIALDLVADMFITVGNVTADMAVAAILGARAVRPTASDAAGPPMPEAAVRIAQHV
jgi:Na+/H+-dicarboxylate symporter